jgi:nicotinamide-nucleotide adenylyltransferase
MIRLALKEAQIDANRFTVLPLPDAEFHKVWVSHLLSQTPSFDLVFTNEPLTGRLLKEAGMRVEKIPMFNRTSFTATEVRKRIVEGRNWEELLPRSVAVYIKKIKGEERMREIAQTDKN